MNEVIETETFSKVYEASEKKEQQWIDKMKDQLVNALLVGKPLRYSWFREKKFENKRLYYLINEKTEKALLVAYGAKKDQQAIITHILLNKERYLKLIS
ncbi:hypothetical protein HYU19_04095 [Candidatus Woesearchaeota archaeon]|nr:hypothetical protein [Candidatus Woesearchaeota archaeon]